MSRPSNPGRPILCYVTDRHNLAASPPQASNELLLETIEAAAQAEVDWIQLREKDLSARACATLTREALRRARKPSSDNPPSVRIVVNDRVDVALAEQADGVHLGENSIPVEEAMRLLEVSSSLRAPRNNFLVGVSCHSVESAVSAANGGADYIFFGPVFSTPSKAAYGAPQGLEHLAAVCRSVSIPVLAIGGITVENTPSCLDAGAAGIAAIRLFQDATDVGEVVRSLHAERRTSSP